jgi:SAM-dependent methyltransferase
MDTANFNRLDHLIRSFRARRVRSFVESGDRVADVGCGHDMWFLRSVADRLASGIGIDPDVTAPAAGPLHPVATDAVSGLSALDAGSLDLVVALASIEHFPPETVPATLAAAQRALRPGGRIVITTPTPRAKPVLELLAFRLRVISAAEVADHKAYYGRDQVVGMLRAAGFADVRYRTFQLGFNSMAVAVAGRGSATGRSSSSPTP